MDFRTLFEGIFPLSQISRKNLQFFRAFKAQHSSPLWPWKSIELNKDLEWGQNLGRGYSVDIPSPVKISPIPFACSFKKVKDDYFQFCFFFFSKALFDENQPRFSILAKMENSASEFLQLTFVNRRMDLMSFRIHIALPRESTLSNGFMIQTERVGFCTKDTIFDF